MDYLFDKDGPIMPVWETLFPVEYIVNIKNTPNLEVCEPYLFPLDDMTFDIKEILLSEYPLETIYSLIDFDEIAMLITASDTTEHLSCVISKILNDKGLLEWLLNLYYGLLFFVNGMNDESSDIYTCYQLMKAVDKLYYVRLFAKGDATGYRCHVFSGKNNFCFKPNGIKVSRLQSEEGPKFIESVRAAAASTGAPLPDEIEFLPYEYLDKAVYNKKVLWKNPK